MWTVTWTGGRAGDQGAHAWVRRAAVGTATLATIVSSTLTLGATSAGAETVPASAAVVRVGDTGSRTVTLSFDDGPDGRDTPKVLDILAAEHITAAFPMVGREVERLPAVAARVVREGHQPVNHSYDHRNFTTLTQAQRWSELNRAEAVFRAHGFTSAGWFRPPYGGRDATLDRDLARDGYYIDLLWSVDTLGWQGVSTKSIVDRVVANLRPGAIVLMHVGGSATDAAALPAVIAAIRAHGYGFASPAQALTHGAIGATYDALGAQRSTLGVPRTVELAEAGGRVQWFQNGRIYWTSVTGAHLVVGGILSKYRSLGGPASFLKFPTADERAVGDGRGRFSVFQGGSIYWTSALGAHEVHGAIRGKWAALGATAGLLGYPTTDEMAATGGRTSYFEHGRIYWSATTNAHEVHGAILSRYSGLGASGSRLGLPTTDEYRTSTGARSDFQHGSITWDSSSESTQVIYR